MKFFVTQDQKEDLYPLELCFYPSGATRIKILTEKVTPNPTISYNIKKGFINDYYQFLSFTNDSFCGSIDQFIKNDEITFEDQKLTIYKIDYETIFVESPSTFIKNILITNNIEQQELKKVLQFSNSTLHRFINFNEAMFMDNLLKTAKFLKINPDELISIANNYEKYTLLKNEKFSLKYQQISSKIN